ncbi:hypothetical protein N9917_04425, partial [Deltaproteobacteria bacterium]|nr:hypothetical protein [Deltaproteobacteria bacterium]
RPWRNLMKRELLEACNTQAERMRVGMEQQLAEMFPDDDCSLVVTGFVFRPSDNTDQDEDSDEEEAPWAFEAHFHAVNHSFVSNTSTKLTLAFDGIETYDDAIQFFVTEVANGEG